MPGKNSKPKKTETGFILQRELDALPEYVWEMHAKAQRLERWWAPRGFKLEVITFDFKEDGSFLYRIKSQEGKEAYEKLLYSKIVPQEYLCFTLCSTNEKGKIIHGTSASAEAKEITCDITFIKNKRQTSLHLHAGITSAAGMNNNRLNEYIHFIKQQYEDRIDRLEEYMAACKPDFNYIVSEPQ
jgi:uncharacterized protein YndB with AHSA1/START domain